eukprot:CAMPEP_0206629640 /NCGR_PEP_ID=MMETSP0325_2-20121206/67147_1 /ASSEMBLY_ACC=CAM_ASM_000347 /TAXON_ID=2866 /ORGANISM="Crypthecodinium cohnii, Strain Seligo" /LENGTH=66 /DNA_ID=CAMNT_0054154445 /DNA_START=648 /DNA_END=845 /DNA_ORIENTATION=-
MTALQALWQPFRPARKARQQERKGSAIYANVCGDAFAWPGCCREEKGHDREEEEHHKGTWCANLRP